MKAIPCLDFFSVLASGVNIGGWVISVRIFSFSFILIFFVFGSFVSVWYFSFNGWQLNQSRYTQISISI